MGTGQVISILVTLVIIALVAVVGMNVADEFAEGIDKSSFEESEPEVTGPPGYGLGVVPTVLLFAGAAGGIGALSRCVNGAAGGDRTELERLKDRYVNGEIGLTEFEDRAYEEVPIDR